MNVRLLLFALLCAAACATATPEMQRGWDASRSAIVVHVASPQPTAYQRTAAAFAAEGLTIDNGNAEAGFLTTTPRIVSRFPAELTVRYRASVVTAQGGSDILLSGAIQTHLATVSDNAPDVLRPSNAEGWAILQRIADRLRLAS